MADNNIFVYIFPSNKEWREKCGTFFLFLFRSKSFFVRNISLEKWGVESALYNPPVEFVNSLEGWRHTLLIQKQSIPNSSEYRNWSIYKNIKILGWGLIREDGAY